MDEFAHYYAQRDWDVSEAVVMYNHEPSEFTEPLNVVHIYGAWNDPEYPAVPPGGEQAAADVFAAGQAYRASNPDKTLPPKP
jgi:hypothetical protein